jgi:hypothetical protein
MEESSNSCLVEWKEIHLLSLLYGRRVSIIIHDRSRTLIGLQNFDDDDDDDAAQSCVLLLSS